MKQKEKHEQYQVGEYIDYENLTWSPKLIVSKIIAGVNEYTYKIKDPRYNILPSETVASTSYKIKPYRSMNPHKGTNQNPPYHTNKWKKIDVEDLNKRQAELQDFIINLSSKNARQIIQFLRGRHYYFAEELINSQLQQKQHYQAMMKYLQTHRQLLVKYVKSVSFQEASSSIYYSRMSALCSSFPQIMDFTNYSFGIATPFEIIRKEYPHWHNREVFRQKIAKWLQQDFYPALMQVELQEFPPNFIFSIFTFLGSLLSRVVTSNIDATPQIYQMLYQGLKRSLHTSSYNYKDLISFEANCQIFFKQFPIESDSYSESSITEQIDAMVDQNKNQRQLVCRRDKMNQIAIREEMACLKKMQFKLHLINMYNSKREVQRYVRDLSNLTQEMNSKYPSLTHNNKSIWPKDLKLFAKTIQEKNLMEATIDLNIQTSDSNLQRAIIMRLYVYFPNQILLLLIEKEKLMLLKHIIQPQSKVPIEFQIMACIIDRIIEQCYRSRNPKEYLDFFNYIQKMLKTLYPLSVDRVRYLRQKIIQTIFILASKLNKQQHRSIIDSLLDFSDNLREEIWSSFTAQQIIPNANVQYSYFYELSIQKYFQKFNINLENFENICKFMIEEDIRQQKYEKRKASVIHSLNYQYRANRSNYLQYLAVFLDYFCHPDHDKEQKQWIALSAFTNDQKYPSFLTLPITQEFCRKYIPQLSPVYYQIDINIFCKLLLKLNILNGRVVVSQQNETISKVLQTPEYLVELFNNSYASLITPRLKLIEKQIQKYFYAAQYNHELYNQMLMMLLQVMIRNQAKRPDINLMFKKLKTRHYLIPKQMNVGTSLKNQEILVCRNRTTFNKCLSIIMKLQKDKFVQPLAQQQRLKINSEVQINRIELIRNIRYRLAFKLNRQPNDIIFFSENQPLEEDKLNLSFQQVYFQQFYSQQKPKENPFIEYQFSDNPTPIREQIINRLPAFYDNLPNSLPLIRGLDLVDYNWNGTFSLEFLKALFKSKLQRGDFCQEQFKVGYKLEMILDFYIWNLEDRQKYNYVPLLKLLTKNQNSDSVLKNYKIVYLLYKSQKIELNYVDCDQLMMCLLPDPSISKDKMDKTLSLKSTKQYELLEQLVLHLIYNYCKNSIQFMATCNFFSQFCHYEQYYPIYSKLWTKIYTSASIQEKQAFFSSIEQTIINFPDNMRQLYTIIDYEQLSNNTQFYQEKIGQLASILLKLDKQNLTLTQMKTIQILITNICELTDQQKIFHPILHSAEMVQFIKNNLYNFNERTQRQLFNIIKIVVSNTENRRQLIQFFEKQAKQKQWIMKPFLMKSVAKHLQFEGRVGLRNPHSVCYANSFLQQLYHIDLFRDQLFDTLYTQNSQQQEDLIFQLKKIFVHLHFGRESYLNMDFFKAFKNMDGEQTNIEVQMDVDQFRNLLLDRIQNAIPSNNNFVKKLFNGKQKSIIKSQECQHQSKRQEQFSSLCVEVKDVNNLEASLDNYFKPQILKNENAYYCDQCKKKVTAQKTIEIEELPPYLTFVLKRFEYVSYSRSKINSYFQFPLHEFKYFQGAKYTLKGVIVHVGISQAGHYISFAKYNGVWYEFNDCNVQEVDERRLRETCFGNNSKVWTISQSRNAYVLIYESEKLPQKSKPEGVDRAFYGIADEYKKIIRNRTLSTKERVYFSQNFLQSLNYIAERFNDSSSLHLLFWTLMVIHLRIKNEYVKHEALLKSFKILKQNKNEFKYLWYEEIDKVKQIFTSNMNPEYKSILIQILVQNCDRYNESVQKMLQICLKKIYQQKIDYSGYYMFMYGMAKKFDEACLYLNSQRIVGRIFDILYMGIVGEKVRQNLKKTCEVQFQQGPSLQKLSKDISKLSFKYYKWALVTYVLQKTNCNLHQIQKQHYLFQFTNLTITTILLQANQKPLVKYISKLFAIIVKENNQLFVKLLNYIGEAIREKTDFRKYLKVLKEILFVNYDDHTSERNRAAVIVFQKFLRKLLDDKRDYSFLYAWQWFLSIIKSNNFFRRKVREHAGIFEYLTAITPQSVGVYRNRLHDGKYKYELTKHPLYGIIAPTTLSEAQTLIKVCVEETDKYLLDQIDTHDSADYDGDIVNIKIEDGMTLLKYEQTELKFRPVTVLFSFGDLLEINDRNQKSRDLSFNIYTKGDECLRLKTQFLPDILIQQPGQKNIQTRKSI